MPDVRLIDANALRKDIHTSYSDDLGILEHIDSAPTIDAQPVKHGKWVRDASGELYCPYCMYVPQWEDDKFCAHCGAKMEVEEDETN